MQYCDKFSHHQMMHSSLVPRPFPALVVRALENKARYSSYLLSSFVSTLSCASAPAHVCVGREELKLCLKLTMQKVLT